MLNPKNTQVLHQWNIELAKTKSIPLFIFGMDRIGNLNIYAIAEVSKEIMIEKLREALNHLTKDDSSRIIVPN